MNKAKRMRKVYAVIEAAKRHAKERRSVDKLESIRLCTRYGEPGYHDPSSGIIAVGSWSDVSHWDAEKSKSVNDDNIMSRLCKVLEKRFKVELEFYDEWEECSACGRLIRNSPNSYDWTPSFYRFEDGDTVCRICANKKVNTKRIIEDVEGNPKKCLTMDLNIEAFGFRKHSSEFERGFHEGMDDSPQTIASTLNRNGIKRYLFTLDSSSQFYCQFSVWIHKSEKANRPLFNDHAERASETSPAENLKRALMSAPMHQPSNGNISITRINADTGESVSQEVSREEFIKGVQV